MMAPFAGCWSAAADFLITAGVRTVFGLPADDLTSIRDLSAAGIRMVVCRDQRNALHMATGFAQQSGSVGVCVVGKGPAVANTVTGLLEAAASRTPVLLLATGTAPARRDAGAFQDADQVALVAPLVKRAFRVDHPDRVAPVLQHAWAVASGGRPGPVYLEFGEQLLDLPVAGPTRWCTDVERSAGHTLPDTCASADLVAGSRRPVVLVGGGARRGAAGGALVEFAELIGAAIVCTASGRGAVDEEHPLFLGLSGLYCRPPVARLLARADLVVSAGSRLEETATTGWLPPSGGPTVVQINIDATEFSHDRTGPLVQGDVAQVLGAWAGWLRGRRRPPGADAEWIRGIAHARTTTLHEAAATVWEQSQDPDLHVAELLWTLRSLLGPDHVLVQENGLQDMWSYLFPYYLSGARGSVVAPSEQTALGFGAAAAGGVAAAEPDRPVVAFVGDGAFALFAVDLPTLAEHGLGVLYIVLANGGYGWLQAESDARGRSVHRFADPTRRLPRIDLDGVHTKVLADKQRLSADLSDAVVRSRSGEPVVLVVPVALTDVPPGIGDILGAGADVAQDEVGRGDRSSIEQRIPHDIGVAGTYELTRE